MKKHLLVLMTVLLGCVTGAQAEDYNLWINGVQVTDANAADLTKIDGVSIPAEGRGWLMYSPTLNALVLENAYITNVGDMEAGIKSSIPSFKIVIIGNCFVQGKYSDAAIRLNSSTTIRCQAGYGSGNLSVFNSNDEGKGIAVHCNPGSASRERHTILTIGDSVTIWSFAPQAVVGDRLPYASTTLKFAGSRSELNATGSLEGYGCISHFSEITLGEGYFLDNPEGAVIEDGAVKINGSVFASETVGACIRQGVQLNSTNFPDAHFRAFLMYRMSLNEGDWLTKQLHQKKLYPQDYEIENLQGLEFFPELEDFSCWHNNLASLDLSQNYQLKDVDISQNHIKGEEMDKLIESLHFIQGEPGRLTVLYQWADGNVITTAQVEAARKKGWKVYSYHYDGDLVVDEEYAGVAPGSILLDTDNIPDPKFRQYLYNECDPDHDWWMSPDDFANVIALNLDGKNIKWLDGIEYFPNLMLLYCQNNKLETLDLSKNPNLTQLYCFNNQLTSLNLSGCKSLQQLLCGDNQLTTLDLRDQLRLEQLMCQNNRLTSLLLFPNQYVAWPLAYLDCQSNCLDKEAMEDVVKCLSGRYSEGGKFYVKDLTDENEQNVIAPSQVHTAKAKGWTVYARLASGEYGEYSGDAIIEPIDEDEKNIDMSGLADQETLENTIVDNVYYNLADGSYNAESQSLTISQTTDMSAIADFTPGSADIVEYFNGIIFEVNGSGVIELDCETAGSLQLNVKVGNEAPQVITKNERGTVEVAYDVDEPTYVYVYATATAGAPRRVVIADDRILIYLLKVKPGAISGIGSVVRDAEGNGVYYTLDGRAINGKPTQQGVYINNGRKVVIK